MSKMLKSVIGRRCPDNALLCCRHDVEIIDNGENHQKNDGKRNAKQATCHFFHDDNTNNKCNQKININRKITHGIYKFTNLRIY